MKRRPTHKPTIEDVVELSGIETLHPGGMALSERTAEVAGLKPGMKVLDVSSGRGTQAIYYAQKFGVEVTGIDLAEEMVRTAKENAQKAGVDNLVFFRLGDSQQLPFLANEFDVVINECAVGIPADSQKVLDEMVRVARPHGSIVIHESTWRAQMSANEKEEISERYGTTPLEHHEWLDMLAKAGVENIESECDPWSRPEMFWKVRQDREVRKHTQVLTLGERLTTIGRIFRNYGTRGVLKALQNEKVFFQTVLGGKLGYCLFWGRKPNHVDF